MSLEGALCPQGSRLGPQSGLKVSLGLHVYVQGGEPPKWLWVLHKFTLKKILKNYFAVGVGGV